MLTPITWFGSKGRPDRELARYLQTAVGYRLTGSTVEHSAFILWGGGSNGKSTFLDAISHVLGTYAQSTPMSTFMMQQGDSQTNDIAGMVSARFVSASGGGEGGKRLPKPN